MCNLLKQLLVCNLPKLEHEPCPLHALGHSAVTEAAISAEARKSFIVSYSV